MKRTTVMVLLVLAAAIGAASVAKTYWVERGVGEAQLLWTADQGYLLVGTRDMGWRFSYLRFLGEVALAVVGTGTGPQDSKPVLMIFNITSTRVERYVLQDTEWSTAFSVFESRLRIGRRWQFTGRQFERTTPEEERRLAQVMPRDQCGDYSDVGGWSRRRFAPGAGALTLPFHLSGQPARLIVLGKSPLSVVTIDLQVNDRAPERLLWLDGRFRHATKADYVARFGH
jgi:hypothetical protein